MQATCKPSFWVIALAVEHVGHAWELGIPGKVAPCIGKRVGWFWTGVDWAGLG